MTSTAQRRTALVAFVALTTAAACGEPQEAARVAVPVFADPSGVAAVTTDLGYTVTLTEARAVIENLEFTIAGEVHAMAPLRAIAARLIPPATAHPGHFQDGETTGELQGRFVLRWLPEDPTALGEATLLVGDYRSANFTFARATTDDGLEPDDPLLDHTALLQGRAERGEFEVDFVVVIDSPDGRRLVGAPFEHRIARAVAGRIGLRLLPQDPVEGDTLFDGIDFEAFANDGGGVVAISPADADPSRVAAYNQFRRTFQTHDHFDLRLVAGED